MAKQKSAPLDPKVAEKLLDKLSTDNEFRRLFKKDPQSALKKVGHKDPETTAAGCLQVQRIAPKADIIKARDALRDYLTSALAMTPIQLDAESTAARRTRK